MSGKGSVYLLHFDAKLAHSQHYLGFAKESVEERFKLHQSGHGARITQVLQGAWHLVSTGSHLVRLPAFRRTLVQTSTTITALLSRLFGKGARTQKQFQPKKRK